MPEWIDLRSDTVTKPTPEMRRAMAEAEVGDDVYGEDPTVNRLERRAAEIFEREAALFVPTGSMGNLICIRIHCDHGNEVICESRGHIFNFEMASMSAIAGCIPRAVATPDGHLTWKQVEPALRPKTYYYAQTRLIALENTHNLAGGTLLPLEAQEEICDRAHERGLAVHLDGARIFNAAISLGVPPSEIAQYSDSVCFCVSKGLSAPVGSILCGSAGFIERARAYRRMVGGNMRQAGPLAAAGIVALETMADRLVEDHQTAKRLAEELNQIDASLCDPKDVETNLVRVDVRKSGRRAAQWSADLKTKGVLVAPADTHALRFVTHRHISAPDVDTAVSAFAELWKYR